MKRKQAGKRKPCTSPIVGAVDGFQEAVSSNAQANDILDYYENDQFTSPKETVVQSVSKKARTMLNTSSSGFSPLNSKPNKKTGLTQIDDANKKNSELARQDPLYNEQKLYSALQTSSSCKLPLQPQHKSFQSQQSFQRTLFSQPDDGIDLSSSEEHFPSPPPMGSMMRGSEHGPSSSYFQPHQCLSHSEPSHLQALIDKEVIEYLCSSSLVDSVKRCIKHGPKHRVAQTKAIDKHDDLLASRQIVTPHPSDPQAGPDKEENFSSTPVVESMIRRTKRGSKCPVGPMNATGEHQGQVESSQIFQPQPSSNSGGPSQHPDGTSQVQLSFSQPQHSQPQGGTTDEHVGERLNKEKAQCRPHSRNRCLEVLNSTEKIPVDVNEFGQAVGLEAPKLTSFLRMIARDGCISPLNYLDWRTLPKKNKERMWQDVLSKFDIHPNSKSWVLKSIGKKWKDWKAELKATRYYTHETDEERIADCDEKVVPDQWRVLVSFWNTQEAKKRSTINKVICGHQQTSHNAGKKSFARVHEEEHSKRPDGKPPSQTEMFILTRTKKNGHPVNAAASAAISKLRETAQQQESSEGCRIQGDMFTQVMGPDRHGYMRTFDLGPSSSEFCGPIHAEVEAMKMATTTKAEVIEIKEKMVSLEQTCAQVATQMTTMMSIVSDMQKKLLDKVVLPPEHSQVANVSMDSRALPWASVQGVSPK